MKNKLNDFKNGFGVMTNDWLHEAEISMLHFELNMEKSDEFHLCFTNPRNLSEFSENIQQKILFTVLDQTANFIGSVTLNSTPIRDTFGTPLLECNVYDVTLKNKFGHNRKIKTSQLGYGDSELTVSRLIKPSLNKHLRIVDIELRRKPGGQTQIKKRGVDS